MAISTHLKHGSILLAERSITTAIFYAAAKSYVKNPAALQWVCAACIFQAGWGYACKWAHTQKTFQLPNDISYLSDRRIPAKFLDLGLFAVLRVAPIIITGSIQKEITTAFVAWIVLDVVAPRLTSRIKRYLPSYMNQPLPKAPRQWREEFFDELVEFGKFYLPRYHNKPQYERFMKGTLEMVFRDLKKPENPSISHRAFNWSKWEFQADVNE